MIKLIIQSPDEPKGIDLDFDKCKSNVSDLYEKIEAKLGRKIACILHDRTNT